MVALCKSFQDSRLPTDQDLFANRTQCQMCETSHIAQVDWSIALLPLNTAHPTTYCEAHLGGITT